MRPSLPLTRATSNSRTRCSSTGTSVGASSTATGLLCRKAVTKPPLSLGYVRSGRKKLVIDTANLYPGIYKSFDSTESLYTGYDFKAVRDLLNLGPSRHFTFVFNTFLWMTIFNFINARKLMDELNVFKGILENTLFLVIVAAIVFS